jgi:hypothetical protein
MRKHFRPSRIRPGYSRANPHYAGHRWRSARRFASDRMLSTIPRSEGDPRQDPRLAAPPERWGGSGVPIAVTPELRTYVVSALELGYTLKQIALAVGCCAKSLQKYFAREIAAVRNRQYVEMMHALGPVTLREATGDPDRLAWYLEEFSPGLRANFPEPAAREPEKHDVDDYDEDEVLPSKFARYGRERCRRRRRKGP